MRKHIKRHEIITLFTPEAQKHVHEEYRERGDRVFLFAYHDGEISKQAFAVFVGYPQGYQEVSYGHPLDNGVGDYDAEVGTREIPAAFRKW